MKRSHILPKRLYEEIRATGINGKDLDLGLSFIDYLFYKYSTNEELLEGTNFIHIPSLTIKSNFSRNYKTRFMDIFLYNNIVIRSPFNHGSSEASHCFGYRINDIFLDFADIEIIEANSKDKAFEPDPVDNNIDFAVNDLAKIDYDIRSMVDYIKHLNVRNLVVLNNNIQEDPVELTPIFSKVKFKSSKTLKDALNLAKRLRKDLIQYDNRFFIAKSEVFIKWKEITLKSSLCYSVRKIYNKEFYAHRNDTNFRLDTNITNLKSDFISQGMLAIDGERLVDIDLKNSQPTLLAFLISGNINSSDRLLPILTEYKIPYIDIDIQDVNLFVKLSESGALYDHIGEMLNWSRKYAKQNFIKSMFADARWSGQSKLMIKSLFPDIINWMDDFKKLNGNTLAVLLQRIESRIFIDHIYMDLHEAGYIVFTKHDSVLCKSTQKPEISDKMKEMLDEYGFKYRLA